jgi:hypothetical protein
MSPYRHHAQQRPLHSPPTDGKAQLEAVREPTVIVQGAGEVVGQSLEVIFPLEIAEAFQAINRRLLSAYSPMEFPELARSISSRLCPARRILRGLAGQCPVRRASPLAQQLAEGEALALNAGDWTIRH